MIFLEAFSLEKLDETLNALPLDARHSRQPVVLNLYGPQILVRQFNLPALPAKEIKNALKLEAAEGFSLPPEEIEIDYQILDALENKTQGVFLAISKSLFNGYVALLKKNNLKPVKITASIFSRVNYFLYYNKPESKSISVIDFYKGNIMNISAFNSKGGCELMREIHYENLDDAEKEIIYSLKYASSRSPHKQFYEIYLSGDLPEKKGLIANLNRDLNAEVKEYNTDSKLNADTSSSGIFFNVDLIRNHVFAPQSQKKILRLANVALAACLLLVLLRAVKIIKQGVEIKKLSSSYNSADYDYAAKLAEKAKLGKDAK